MELEDAEKEVCRLEQEARRALEENKRYCKDLSTKKSIYNYILCHYFKHICSFFNLRVQNESQNVPAIIGPEDSNMKSKSQDCIGRSNH